MGRLIRTKQKSGIMILAGVNGLIGTVAGSIGLYLRTKLTTSGSWDQGWIPQFTNGYFGVMSGYMLFLLGTVGYSLVDARIFYLVLGYGFLSLSCDTLCILDALMVIPYTKDYGRFAWDEQECMTFNATTNSTIIINPNPITESCADIKIIAILLICVTIAVLIAFVLSTATTVVTSVALCRARALISDSGNQPSVELSPYSPEDLFTAINYDNALYQNHGFRP